MEEGFTRRLFLPDVRGARRYLRVTWHQETSTVVFSHWQDDVCVATAQIGLRDATQLISLLVGVLKESALTRSEAPGSGPSVPRGLLGRVRGRFSPQIAQIIRLHDRLRAEHSHDRSTGS